MTQPYPSRADINRNQIQSALQLAPLLYTQTKLRMMVLVKSTPDHTRSQDARPAFVLTILALLTSVACAFASPTGLHHFDDLNHYLYARWAWTWPSYLLNHWGRPGFTVLYFPAAAFGWTACRVLSAILSAATGWYTFRIAQRMNLKHPSAVILLVWLQPLFFALSQTTLTETPLAFYLALALLLASSGRWSLSSAALSAAFVTRHEAILFLPIWLLFAARARVSLWRLWPLLWAPLVVNAAAYLAGMTTIIGLYLQPRPSNQYGTDGWWTFFARSLHAWGPAVSILTWTGVIAALGKVFQPVRERRGNEFTQTKNGDDSPSKSKNNAEISTRANPNPSALDARATTSLVVTSLVAYFTAQTLIRVFGLFDSGGYARFLVPIAPMAALMALLAWNELNATASDTRRAFAALSGAVALLLWLSLEVHMIFHAGIETELPQLRQAVIAMRYISPAIALLAIISAIRFTRPLDFIAPRALPAGLLVLLALTACVFLHPLPPPPEAPIVAEAIETLKSRGLGDRPIISAVVWLDFVQSRQRNPDEPSTRERIEQAPIGTLVAWEKQFAGSPDHNLQLEEFTRSPAFRHVLTTRPKPHTSTPYLEIFEKIGTWGPNSAQESP